MKRIILDTNIYGEIAKEANPSNFLEKITSQKEFIFYGIREIIRAEVKNTPKNIMLSGRSLRMLLLSIYDLIVKEHELKLDEEIRFLAERYYDAYREFGGSKSKESVITDFQIVACASAKGMDILVSNDNSTMLTENAVRAYNLINKTRNIKMPDFTDYLNFKRRLFSL